MAAVKKHCNLRRYHLWSQKVLLKSCAFGVLWALLILKLFRISLPVVDSPLVGWPLHPVGGRQVSKFGCTSVILEWVDAEESWSLLHATTFLFEVHISHPDFTLFFKVRTKAKTRKKFFPNFLSIVRENRRQNIVF